MFRTIFAAPLMALLLATASPALAEPGQSLGKFGDWETALFKGDKGNNVCYMAAKPISTDSAAPVKGRDPNVMLFITHWPGDDEKNAVTVSAGFTYKPGSKATVVIGGEEYSLAAGGKSEAEAQMAWVDNQKKEDELASAIQKGDKLTFKATSKRGNIITDTYSLSGSADAYKAISKACGY
jgi:Invasion associated locus B (IalB) protein